MQKKDVKINGVYTVKVARNRTRVRITQVNSHGGWDGVNTATGKNVRIKSAQRLLVPVDSQPEPAEDDSIEAKPCPAMFQPSWPDADKADKTTNAKPKRDTGEPAATETKPGDKPNKPLSLINAAAIVLEACDRPLSCKEIIAKAIDAEIWQPKEGKTPSNTLYASLLREIKNKADDARFEKADRGKFTLKQA